MFNTASQAHTLQALVEPISKHQALKSARKDHIVQALVQTLAKGQALKAVRQYHMFQALVKILTKNQAICSLQGKATSARLWLNSAPKVRC